MRETKDAVTLFKDASCDTDPVIVSRIRCCLFAAVFSSRSCHAWRRSACRVGVEGCEYCKRRDLTGLSCDVNHERRYEYSTSLLARTLWGLAGVAETKRAVTFADAGCEMLVLI